MVALKLRLSGSIEMSCYYSSPRYDVVMEMPALLISLVPSRSECRLFKRIAREKIDGLAAASSNDVLLHHHNVTS